MRILQVNNFLRGYGGEQVVFEETCRILRSRGHEVKTFTRDSADIGGVSDKVRAFASSLYSRSSRRDFDVACRSFEPDLVHVHNVYPLISPSIFSVCEEHDLPVVMRCPNFKLLCPAGSFLDGSNRVCERCMGGREYWCVLKNCRRDLVESVAYATRNTVSRTLRQFRDHVTLYVCPSQFVKRKLEEGGYDPSRIAVLPNTVPSGSPLRSERGPGRYVAYAGRVSREKGIDTLLRAAEMTGIPVRIAGSRDGMEGVPEIAPGNVTFLGHLEREEMASFYEGARCLVLPSVCYETFGIVLIEAMSNGLPVIASRIGGIPEVVSEGETGLLFEPGDVGGLAEAMRLLWEDESLGRRMGRAGRAVVEERYNNERYYRDLLALYERAISMKGAVNADHARG